MKKIIILLTIFFITSCEDDIVDNNKFLPNISVNFSVDLNLPEGNNLLINGFNIFPNQGIRGVIVFNNGLNNYVAFDMACPHINLQDCSTMTFQATDLYMKCGCDGEEFSKIDGAPKNPAIQYAARAYTVTKTGNVLYIHN